jgi:hypothetical protein
MKQCYRRRFENSVIGHGRQYITCKAKDDNLHWKIGEPVQTYACYNLNLNVQRENSFGLTYGMFRSVVFRHA